MPNLGWMEILIILAIVLLLFGANKLPDLARSMGRSARIFKSEVKELRNDDEAQATPQQPAQSQETKEVAPPSNPQQQTSPNAQQSFWDAPENQHRQ